MLVSDELNPITIKFFMNLNNNYLKSFLAHLDTLDVKPIVRLRKHVQLKKPSTSTRSSAVLRRTFWTYCVVPTIVD